MTVARFGAFLRGLLLLLCLALFLTGCTGGKPATDPVTLKDPVPADSLKAIFSLTIHSPDGKSHDLDAVLFSVPNKRYRMELTGSLGVGVASLLWLPERWQMVFPTEKMFMEGAGYMVGLFNDPSLPLVHIHQVAALFDGKVLPEKFEVKATRYERSLINRALCLEYYGYSCYVCGFNFEKTYGEIGHQFIHVHHIVPVSQIGSGYIIDPIKDLIPVCPNCHAMLHRKNPPYLPEELKLLAKL